jgi:glutathione S-transferase
MTKYRLIYFNGRGRAELSRLIAAAGNLDFEDVRIEFSDWPALKQSMFYFFILM